MSDDATSPDPIPSPGMVDRARLKAAGDALRDVLGPDTFWALVATLDHNEGAVVLSTSDNLTTSRLLTIGSIVVNHERTKSRLARGVLYTDPKNFGAKPGDPVSYPEPPGELNGSGTHGEQIRPAGPSAGD